MEMDKNIWMGKKIKTNYKSLHTKKVMHKIKKNKLVKIKNDKKPNQIKVIMIF